MILSGNGVVAQSGGPTAVINNSVCGVVQEWLKKQLQGTLYGAVNGIEGIINKDLINLSSQTSEFISGLRYTPGAAIGSCRYKVKEDDYLKIIDIFKELNIRYFFYIGGNDSMDTANKIYQLAKNENFDLRVVGIPKTIDNDLPYTDHCPGYGSAAKYLATTVLETSIDLKSLMTKNKVAILEVMGRDTGWLTAAASLARRNENDAPHLIYLPELPFHKESFISDVENVYKRVGYVYIVVSEGLVDQHGNYLSFNKATETDSFGHVCLGGVGNTLQTLIEKNLGLKVRSIVLGTAQRSAMHFASLTDAEEAYMVGVEAVRMAVAGKTGLMVTLVREEDEKYYCLPGSIELAKVANKVKKLPSAWISADRKYVNDKFIKYARPLLQGEVPIPIYNGLPDYVSLEDAKCRVS